MLKNYFTVAIRHLTRHRLFSIINILCLAIGITFSMLIGVYVFNKKTINANIKNVNSQYIIKSNWKVKGMGLDITTLAPLAKTVKEEYPNLVANFYRFNPVTNVISAGDRHFKEDIAIGDTTFVSMYGFPLLYGNKQQAFRNNNSAVITETLAMKLFGTKDAVNKTISIHTTVNGAIQDYIISAVLKDIPYNSITNYIGDTYNVFVPTTENRYYAGGDPAQAWNMAYEVGMIELKPGVSPKELEQPFKQLLAKYTPDSIKNNLKVELEPVKSYHLKANNSAVQKMVTALSIVAAFILLMAIINFININIGTSSYRLKEIGLRKVFGSAKLQLVVQFIIEACLLTFVAAAISVTLYELLRPVFNQLLNTALTPLWQFNFFQLLLLLLIVIMVGIVSGIYPAFVLSSINIINSVKGKMDAAKGGLFLRKVLLIVQFSLAIIVFISALTVSRQVAYVFNKDLGYNKEQLLVVTAFPKQWDTVGVMRMENIKKGLLQLPIVKNASIAFDIPERKPASTISLEPFGRKGSSLIVSQIDADELYAATFGLQLKAGSFFNHGNGSYIPWQIVLNETAAKLLGLTAESAIGKRIKNSQSSQVYTIAGVIKDYNYASLQQAIEPLAFVHVNDAKGYRYLTLKLNTSNVTKAIEDIRQKWKSLSPNAPFEYTFMDEKFQSLYQSELQLKKAANVATGLNLIIVFLGIFGVVAITLTKRTKEIAMRKVLGADVKNIVLLFIKDYAWLIAIANMIAWPLAYAVINQWLQNYAYRIQQDMIPYLFVCAFTFISAFSLIAAQCFKTATANPVKSLRTE